MTATLPQPRRRRWPTWSLRIVAVVAALLAVWAFVWEPGRLVERDYALALPHWPSQCDGLRIDVVADLHTGSPNNGVDKLDRLVSSLTRSDAQAVLLAGDYVILSVFLGEYVPIGVIAPHLRPLTARKPVYAVLGNHDWWKDGRRIRHALESAGVVVLDNESAALTLGGCRVTVAGIGDLWEGRPDPATAFAGARDGVPVIALTHNPDLFPRIPPRASLTIAGHTHGGQVDLPLIGRPFVPSKLGDRYAIGHVVENGRHLFVSPGIGTSIVPVRFRVPPEISRLTLRSERAEP